MERNSVKTSHLSGIFLPVLMLWIFSGCSTSNQETYNPYNKNNNADQTFSFHNTEEGKDIQWEVNFDNGKIRSVYKDGQRIPDNEIDNYRDMIYDRLNLLQDKSHHITVDLNGFNSDMEKFKDEMQKFKNEMKDKKYDLNFDNEGFKKGMKELSKELSRLKNKKIEIEFDADSFKDEMEKLKKDIKIDIHINKDELRRNIDEMNEEIQKHHNELGNIDIDLSGLNEVMSNLGESMGKLNINLDGLDNKLQKLNSFTDKLKDELLQDELINSKSDNLNLDLYENGMEVNGKKVPEELFEKYKKLYEDNFGKKLSGENHFRIVE